MPTQRTPQQAIELWIELFNSLPSGLNDGRFAQLTHPDIRFVDPFHDVCGQQQVHQVLQRFSDNVRAIHFDVEDIAWSGSQRCYLRWHFSGQLQRLGHWQFTGVSELVLDEQGRVQLHRDYWDASNHFYMKLPLLGSLLRWLQRRIAGPTT